MEQQPIERHSYIARYIGILIAGVIIGVSSTFLYFKKVPQSTLPLESARQEGFDSAVSLIKENSFGGISSTSNSIYELLGVVTEVQGNRITIHTQSNNPFDDQTLSERTVLITSDTKIFNISFKKRDVMQSEMEAFTKATQIDSSGTQTEPPEPFTRTHADIIDIKVGKRINVFAVDNIKSTRVFSAREVQIEQDSLTPINN
ncbi:hypothetical protein EPN27_00215 [Patescibacteria group bacterium]|nr:MAG: hypothetical protein EPN27_00215 [Patescibacteria group bacterium]